jgi:hypothetical protein
MAPIAVCALTRWLVTLRQPERSGLSDPATILENAMGDYGHEGHSNLVFEL